MNISPVSMDQVMLGRDGREYLVTGEAAGIAAQLHQLEPSLRVSFNEGGMYFVVSQMVDAAGRSTAIEDEAVRHECVMRVPMGEWDGRVVREWEMRAHELRHGISAADRLDADDDRRHADTMYAFEQEVKERAYPLFRSFQRATLGINPRIYLGARKRHRGTS
jgi:hypothetical protein